VSGCSSQATQPLTVPSSFSQLTLGYWLYVAPARGGTVQGSPNCSDTFTDALLSSNGSFIPNSTITNLCNGVATSGWVYKTLDVTQALQPYKGQPISLYFSATTNASTTTHYFIDDVSFTVQ
jgi:hypothetical protein